MKIPKRAPIELVKQSKRWRCFSRPSVYHALVVIFLEFFAYGLLTVIMIKVLNETFPNHTLLMNGLIQGVKGFLSFLSAPMLGALSDVFGRKPFLFLTVTFTCLPIPFMHVSHLWYFTLMTFSGIFAVTFSVVFAYVADITTEKERSWSYGLVSATFAASLITSPAIGAYMSRVYGDVVVIVMASTVAVMDVLFILLFVPESLPKKCRPLAEGKRLTWDKADPFHSLKQISSDHLILMLCITTFLSYLPEAGEYSSFFVYLQLIIEFSEESVALFIAVLGIVSCLAQTVVLNLLILTVGPKKAIIMGLVFEMIQLACYGFATQRWILWMAGALAGLGSITYPALSAFVSNHTDASQQGVAQGVLTGIRGLCNGLGPALYGFLFYIFQVDLYSGDVTARKSDKTSGTTTAAALVNATTPNVTSTLHNVHERFLPGPPFAFGAVLVFVAILFTILIPNNPKAKFTIIRRSRSLLSEESEKEDCLGMMLDNSGSSHHEPLLIVNGVLESSNNASNTAVAASADAGDTETEDSHDEGDSAFTRSSTNNSNANSTARRFMQFWMRWRRESRGDRNSSSSSSSLRRSKPPFSLAAKYSSSAGGVHERSSHHHQQHHHLLPHSLLHSQQQHHSNRPLLTAQSDDDDDDSSSNSDAGVATAAKEACNLVKTNQRDKLRHPISATGNHYAIPDHHHHHGGGEDGNAESHVQ